MEEAYISDRDYPIYFSKLNGLRNRIAADLPLRSGTRILDLATGDGHFAIELARRDSSLMIIGIDVSQYYVLTAKTNVENQRLGGQIEIIEMDAIDMSFPDGEFHMVANFTGLDEVYMTRGKGGVNTAFVEVSRILKPGGYFCFAVMPPEEMETEAQRLEVAVFSYVCNATYLSGGEYESMLKKAGLELVKRKAYYTGMKLTPEQAKEEIRSVCDNVPKIYGISAQPLETVWQRFGKDIQKEGMGYYSKVVLFVGRKANKTI